MHNKKTCKEVAVESKCRLCTWLTWIFDTDVADSFSPSEVQQDPCLAKHPYVKLSTPQVGELDQLAAS